MKYTVKDTSGTTLYEGGPVDDIYLSPYKVTLVVEDKVVHETILEERRGTGEDVTIEMTQKEFWDWVKEQTGINELPKPPQEG